MSVGRFLQQAAAGNAGGATYVDDVFSTYLYNGNGSVQAITNNIALGDGLSGGDYTNVNGSHYLTKSGDLTGNTDGKACTVSCWINTTDTNGTIINNTNSRFVVRVSSGKLNVYAKNTSDVNVLYFTTNLDISIGKWINVLFSFDLSSSSNRSVYINDVEDTSVTWSTYSNENIDRASTGTWYVGISLTADLVHIFQSNSYTDLSVQANRRNFITSDKLPTSVSTVSALSPILYLPLTSAYTIGKNLGTGGDFTTSGAGVTSVNNGDFTAVEGKGGLVWLKNRASGGSFTNNVIVDSTRTNSSGYHNNLYSNLTDAQYDPGALSNQASVTGFNSNGFSLGGNANTNYNGGTYASWTFRKQPGFFDVVTWTGDDVQGRSISHNLGQVPGCIIVKITSGTSDNWVVYHRSTGAGKFLKLNATDAQLTSNAVFPTTPTDSVFYVGNDSAVNWSGGTYVAYLFAHDDQSFGTDSDESIIKCGSFTATQGVNVELGFEPQWIMVKSSTSATDWYMFDNMRGWGADQGSNDQWIYANASNAEVSNTNSLGFHATGFTAFNGGAQTYIYVAIRRPHKPASEFAATDLFDDFKYKDNTLVQTDNPIQLTSDRQTGGPAVLTDMWWHALRGTTYPAGKSNSFFINSRLQGAGKGMITNGTNAEPAGDASEMRGYDRMTGVEVGPNGTFYYYSTAAGNRDHISYYFRRAPGFFDVVAYTGDGTSSHAISHNLGVTPELMIVKRRNASASWYVWESSFAGTNDFIFLNFSNAKTSASTIFPSDPTSSAFTVGSSVGINNSSDTFIAYLFATVPGISKVGSYSGTGSNVDVDCGFTSGARFVLVKRTDSTGDWYVWDSARGIVAGNDGYLLLNSNAAEVTSTDYIDPLSSGFTITSTAPAALNASGGTYIFLAIA